jgi:hypothetical protein
MNPVTSLAFLEAGVTVMEIWDTLPNRVEKYCLKGDVTG